jgi:hypothetical protein
MRKIERKVLEEVHTQLEKAHFLKKQSTTMEASDGETEVQTYWVGNVVRVDIKLPKEKEVVV